MGGNGRTLNKKIAFEAKDSVLEVEDSFLSIRFVLEAKDMRFEGDFQ